MINWEALFQTECWEIDLMLIPGLIPRSMTTSLAIEKGKYSNLRSFFFDMVQGRMNETCNETRTRSWRFACLIC